eukprot:683003_1
MSSTETVYFEILLALAFCIAVSNLLHTYKIGVIHESGSSIIVGVLVSGLILLSGTKFDGGTFNPDFFFYALLPPIIFTAGYLLKKKKFFANYAHLIPGSVCNVHAFYNSRCVCSTNEQFRVDSNIVG